LLFADEIHLHDVRVTQASGCAGFLFESVSVCLVGHELRTQDLDGDVARQRWLYGQPDFGHPTATQTPEQLKFAETHVAQIAPGLIRLPLALARAIAD
jgi:hypothetical protein